MTQVLCDRCGKLITEWPRRWVGHSSTKTYELCDKCDADVTAFIITNPNWNWVEVKK